MIMRVLWMGILLAAANLPADIGAVLSRHDVPCAQPFGLARLSGRLLIADRATGLLYAFSLETRAFTEAGHLPCSRPLGIAADDNGLWMYDAITKHIYHYLLDKKRVDQVLVDVEAEVEGLAWDGSSLWATAGKQFLKVDPSDGTTIASFDGPGPDTSGIAFDGSYLWLSERQRDRLAVALPDGTLFGTLPAPGPYPAGIARTGDSLWVLDFQERRLYELDIAPHAHPYYTGAPHRRTVRFTDTLINRGPSGDATGRIYACAGEEDAHQKILSPALYSPAGAVSFVSDLWRQQFALREGPIPAGGELRLDYTVGVETHDLNWFILPEWVKPVEAIPQGLRSTYLADGSKLGILDPFIRNLAGKIVAGETNPFWIAFRIHQYLHTTIEYQRTGGWNKASTILKRGNGSCSEFTFAFMALARAAGLPARYEAGIVVRGDDGSIDDVYHRWAQIYLPPFGWIPVDPSKGKPATAMDVASSFGSLSHRFFITTHSGGDSPILGWTYNYRSFYEFSGVADIIEQNEAKWDPLPEDAPAKR
jgi:transglutaminase-like putative cysteine protease